MIEALAMLGMLITRRPPGEVTWRNSASSDHGSSTCSTISLATMQSNCS
jgi:hypothetical protein